MTAPRPNRQRWPLPRHDFWSTPFADALLHYLDLRPGLSILDVACGHGVPSFYLAEQVGPNGRVVGVDLSAGQVARARAIQGAHLPWLRFECADVRGLPSEWPSFDRITGNLSVMFFRPNRYDTLRGLIAHLRPGGQLVLTFPSLGTFDSLWQRIERELTSRRLHAEQRRFQSYLAERPSAQDARIWLDSLALDRIVVEEWPLEIATGSGDAFLYHPLLRGGFLDDVYECFDDARLADEVMVHVSKDVTTFLPLVAQRCVMAGWRPI
ncbi:hypothetical protein YTPLAS18_30720 [Nitrospira sp.]|nr:hypothetical protein YTPLAS18_30720 [Nitrospira sp.]